MIQNTHLFKEVIENNDQIIALIDSKYNIKFLNKKGRENLKWNPRGTNKCYELICNLKAPHAHCIYNCTHESHIEPVMINGNSFSVKSNSLENGYRVDYLKEVNPQKRSDESDNANRNEYFTLKEEYTASLEELKEKNDLISNEKEKFKLLFSNMNAAFALHEIILDNEGKPCDYRFLECNDMFENQTGLKRTNILGKTILDIMPNTEKYWIETYGKVALSGKPHDFTNYSKELDKYYETRSYCPQRVFFAVTFRDVTKRLKAEKNLSKKNEELKITVEELNATKDALKIKLETILNPDKQVLNLQITDFIEIEQLQKIQDSFANATGVASVITSLEGEPITKPSNFSKLCSLVRLTKQGNENCQKSDKVIGDLAKTHKKSVVQRCLSCGLYDAGTPISVGGKVIAYWLIGQVRTNEVNEIEIVKYAEKIGADVIEMKEAFNKIELKDLNQFKNITMLLEIIAKNISHLAYDNIRLAQQNEKVKKQEKLLKVERDNAVKANKLKSAFLANISHEIRTPLNGILGFSEFLIRGKNKTEEQRGNYAKIIKNSSDNLLNIVNDIIDISKIESNTLSIKKSFFAPYEINTQLEQLFSKKILETGKKLHLRLNNHHEQLHINNDKIRYQQIVSNLLDNAIKFTEDGFIEFGVNNVDNNYATFYVKDTGIGIPKENHRFIFERFAQSELTPNRVYSGTGLGLSIVQELLQIMDGDIWLDSTPQKGATFYFKLPYIAMQQKKSGVNNSANIQSEISSKRKILIVEDDKANGLLLEEFMQELNVGYVLCTNGNDVLSMLESNVFDLILMDIKLPGNSGLDITRQIRKKNIKTPILAQTAYAMDIDEEEAKKAGCNDFIAKPINRKLFYEKINSLIKTK